TGHKCDDTRQEFILLSDVLGVSMLVDAINHPPMKGVTESTVFGPFYVNHPPEFQLGDDLSGKLEGEPMYIEGTVSSADGSRLAGATIDVWHSDGIGNYDVQQLDKIGGFGGRGVLKTDANGQFRFWTIRPVFYPVPTDGPVGELLRAQARHPFRPAHVHFMLHAPGHERLVTHVFGAGDKYIDSDAVFGVKDSLIRTYVKKPAGTAPDGRKMDQPYYYLDFDFVMRPAVERKQRVAQSKAEASSTIAYVPK
ncbi:MAG TPA: dioxygenase, partial [Candidatus Binataceae bacterium]|nr:dioxygenase [Candidatus Binataceae bacterium]